MRATLLIILFLMSPPILNAQEIPSDAIGDMGMGKIDTVVSAKPHQYYYWANANLSATGILGGQYPYDCNANFSSKYGTITAKYTCGSIEYFERSVFGRPPTNFEMYGLLYGIRLDEKWVSFLFSSGVSIVKDDNWVRTRDTTVELTLTAFQSITYGIYEERRYTTIGYPLHTMILYHGKYLGVSFGMDIMYSKDVSFIFPCIGIVVGKLR